MPTLLVFLALAHTAQSAFAQIPAFPGAEGFGAYATGGRGGDVYYVNTVNPTGPGSFADAITTVPANGRTIVFSISGYIHVNKTSLSKSKVTIAGQTAPGDGIGFKDGSFIINGSNIIIRHARFRYGDQVAGGDCINLDEGITNTILDHVSLAFSTDENISSFSQNPRPDFFTFQWSLNAWGLESHSCGGLWDLNRVTTHHSLWAHHHTRNPKARPDGLLDWINNVTFDWDIGFIMGDSTTPATWKANVRGNYFICPPGNIRSVALQSASLDRNGGYNFTLHAANNLFDKNGDALLNGTDYGYGIASGSYQVSNTPIAVLGPQVPVVVDSPLTAYKKIVSRAGPLRLDALAKIPLRDEVDSILINNLTSLHRNHVSHENQTGASNNGMGSLNSTPAPVDADRDGMPDVWEQALGWNPAVQDHNAPMPNSGGVLSGLTFFPPNTPAGYTRLEETLHFLAIPHATIPKNTAAAASSLTVDLRKYVSGFNRPPVSFSLSNVTNGTAVLQPDGSTVVFTPTRDFSGRARFDFAVRDGDGSSWTQTLAVLVSAVGAPRNLIWKGDGTANLWNAIALSFIEGTNLAAYAHGDNVRFDGTGSMTPPISLGVSVAPGFVEVNAAGNYTFNGPGALAGPGTLTKTGSGTLNLNLTNAAFTGNVRIDGGTLNMPSSGSVLTSGDILFGGGTLNLPPTLPVAYAIPGDIVVTAGQTGIIYSPGLANRLDGKVISGNDASLLKLTGGVSFGGVDSTQFDGFGGVIHILPGSSLRFSSPTSGNTFGSLNPTFIIDGALRPRNAGNNIRLGALSGSGSIEGPQSNAGGGDTTYIIGGHNLDATFSGNVSSNNATPGTAVVLRKIGVAKLTLRGASTFTGGTTVEAGSLIVNNTAGSGTGSGALAIASGVTLGGSGFIGSLTSLANGAILAPGDSLGTLTFNHDLHLGESSLLNFELGFSSDAVVANGGLTLDGTLNILPAEGFGAGSYTLFTYNPIKTFNNGGLMLGTVPAGFQCAINTNTPGQVKLEVTPRALPTFDSIVMDGGDIVISGNGGTAAVDYYVLGTTNLSTPLAQWTQLATNQFDGAGAFAWTNRPKEGIPQQFYRITY